MDDERLEKEELDDDGWEEEEEKDEDEIDGADSLEELFVEVLILD